MTPNPKLRLRRLGLALGLAALAAGGCRDELVQPTQGTLVLDWGAWEEVEVFVDDGLPVVDRREWQLPEGSHRVRVERDCFETRPGEVSVFVEAGREVVASFVLEPRPDELGTARVSTTHELTGEEIRGAPVFRETAPGVFTSTGQTTPAVVANVPCGTARFRVGGLDYEASTVTLRVPPRSDAQVDVALSPLRAVLAEMFTYFTCPNCYEAADELLALSAQRPGEIYVVEWHARQGQVFFQQFSRERQAFYGAHDQLGYPHTIFQGVPPLIIGSESSQLDQYEVRTTAVLSECSTECAVAIESTADFGVSTVDATVWLKHRSGALPGDLRLRFVVVEGGFYYGPTLHFDSVARAYEERRIDDLVPGEVAELSIVEVPLDPSWVVSNLDYVVYVQSDATGEILAVDGSHGGG